MVTRVIGRSCLFLGCVVLFMVACGCRQERNETPESLEAVDFLPCEFDIGDCGYSDFEEAGKDQHYEVIPLMQDTASDAPHITVVAFKGVCKYRVGVLYIETHGGKKGFVVEAFVTRDARDARYNLYVDPDGPFRFGGLIFRTEADPYYVISVNDRFLRRFFNSKKTLVVNNSCQSWYLADDFRNARDSLGYRRPVSLWHAKIDMDNFWGCMDGTKPDGKEGTHRPTEQAHEYVKIQRPASALDFDADSTKRTVLAPRVVRVEPETCVSAVRERGGVQFDCTMNTSVDPRKVVTAEGATLGRLRWVRRYGIVFDVAAVDPGATEVTFTVHALEAVSRNNEAYLDGNIDPTGTNAVGPNRDNYVWKVPVCILEPDVSTDKASYLDGETVTITAKVVDKQGKPVERATVRMVITTANSSTVTARGLTDSNGEKKFTYQVNIESHGEGRYKVDLTATKRGYRSGRTSCEFWVTSVAPPTPPNPDP